MLFDPTSSLSRLTTGDDDEEDDTGERVWSGGGRCQASRVTSVSA